MMGETLSYVVNSATWSVAGFLLGWAFSREAYYVQQIKEATVNDDTGGRKKPPRNRHIPQWIGVMLIVMAILTVGQATWTTWQQQEQAECQARVNSKFIESLSARAEAAEADREAFTNLVRTLVRPPEEDAQRALRTYLRTLERTNEKRDRNPYPPLPEETCG